MNYKNVISVSQILILIGAMIATGVCIFSVYMANIWGNMYRQLINVLPILYGVIAMIIFALIAKCIWRKNPLIAPLVSIVTGVILLFVQIYLRNTNIPGALPNNSFLLFYVSAALFLSFVADIGKFIHK